MNNDVRTIIYKQNYEEYFRGCISFDAILKVIVKGKPEVHRTSKKALGIGDSFNSVSYYYPEEILYIAEGKIEQLKTVDRSKLYLGRWEKVKERARGLV